MSEQAKSRVLARLLASLVNERFVEGLLLNSQSLPSSLQIKSTAKFWICIINSNNANSQKIGEFWEIEGTFWFPLQGLPALQECSSPSSSSSRYTVSLLDLEDIAFPVLQKRSSEHEDQIHHSSYVPADVRTVMQQLKVWNPDLKPTMVEQITQEMENTVVNQAAAYHQHCGRSLSSLASSKAIEWEQIIVEGHPIHPMYKSRFAIPPTLPVDPWNNDLLNPRIYFFAVPRSEVIVHGEFDKLLAPLLLDPVAVALVDPQLELIIPVHEIQLPNIKHYFPFARQLPFTRKAKAQASLRTVVLQELPELNIKLAVGMKIGSAMRTITPCTTHIGPAFKTVADALIEDKQLLEAAAEIATVVSSHPDQNIAKHLSCIIRQDPQQLANPRGEKVVVCSALKERYPDVQDDFVINQMLKLDTSQKKERFFQQYARLFLKAFLPPLFMHGVSFEAHLQNVLARFRPAAVGDDDDLIKDSHWQLVGFTVRDFGGIKVHQATLLSTTGLRLDVLDEEESTKLAQSLEEVHQLAYHSMIQGHLQPIARALGVHYNCRGWEFVRQELDAILPQDCHTRRLWLENQTSNWKAFIQMKFQDLYRDYIYTPVPNLIVYRPPADLQLASTI